MAASTTYVDGLKNGDHYTIAKYQSVGLSQVASLEFANLLRSQRFPLKLWNGEEDRQ